MTFRARFTVFLAMLSVWLAPALVLAQEVAPAPAGSSTTQTIIYYVMQIVALAVISLAGWGGKLIADKLGIEKAEKASAAAMTAAEWVTDAAEEWGEARFKLDPANKPTSTEKVEYAYGLMKAAVPKLNDSAIDGYIKAALARKAGVGATGDRMVGKISALTPLRDPYPSDPPEPAGESDG